MVTKQDVNAMRSYYQSHYGNVDAISHAFGVANHERFYSEMVSWHSLIDAVFLDYFPFNTVQGLLQSVIDRLYAARAQDAYNKGVDAGRAIVGRVEQVMTDLTNRITNAVNDMRNRIQNDIINPLQNYVNQIKSTLDDAQSRINSLGADVQNALSNVNVINARVNGFADSIANFQSNIDAFNGRINDLKNVADSLDARIANVSNLTNNLKATTDSLNTQIAQLNQLANAIEARLKQAETVVDSHKISIQDLYNRVSRLEGTSQPTSNKSQSILKESLLF